jgi:hypothetical protein
VLRVEGKLLGFVVVVADFPCSTIASDQDEGVWLVSGKRDD